MTEDDATLDFSQVARKYESAAVVQQKAADRLFQLLDIKATDSVCDIGCGSGSLTARIRGMSAGRVVGLDAAPGMIDEALRTHTIAPGPDGKALPIDYRVARAQDLVSIPDLADSFDIVFCNSTLHWIKPVQAALEGFRHVLKRGGKIGVQSAAMSEYCPNFMQALDRVREDPRTAAGFKDFVPPWTFLESEEAYASVFSKAGFRVPYVALETTTSRHTIEEAFGVFSAGAAAGYLNQVNYRRNYQNAYMQTFLTVIHEAFTDQASPDGTLDLTFHRVYIIAFG